jgi:DNA-directed RNA polymerase subunit RPC12/RpoP
MTELRGVPGCSYLARLYPCRKCGQDVAAIPGGINAQHGFRLNCSDCGSFVGWSGYLATLKDKHLKFLENTMENLPATNQPQANTPAIPGGNLPSLTLHGDPAQALVQGQRAAKALWDFAAQGDAVMTLQGKKYLKSEGWVFLGRAFGLTARVVNVTQILEKPQTFQALAEIVDSNGQVVGSGIGICGRDEKMWSNRPLYAVMSMAQTRAVSRAFRSVLSWVAVLAGCAATPSEEMDGDIQDVTWTPAPPAPQARTPQPPAQPANPAPAAAAQPGPAPTVPAAQSPPEQPQNQGQGLQPDMINEPQRKKIFAMGRELGLNKDEILARCNGWLRKVNKPEVASIGDLDKWAASGLIEAMGKAKPTVDPALT